MPRITPHDTYDKPAKTFTGYALDTFGTGITQYFEHKWMVELSDGSRWIKGGMMCNDGAFMCVQVPAGYTKVQADAILADWRKPNKPHPLKDGKSYLEVVCPTTT